jgi:hypothetical protein
MSEEDMLRIDIDGGDRSGNVVVMDEIIFQVSPDRHSLR